MIRNKRIAIGIGAIGLALSIYLLVSSIVAPPPKPVWPTWVTITIYAVVVVGFLFNIADYARRPTPIAIDAGRNRSLWMTKGVLIAVVLVVGIVVLVFTHR